MKRLVVRVFVPILMVLVFAGCSRSKADTPKETVLKKDRIMNTDRPKPTSLHVPENGLTYTTITEWFDWGPAITKVILNVGVPIDESALSPSTFTVSCVRAYNVDGSAPDSKEQPTTIETKKRKVVKVYCSDETGKAQENGTYVTIEMEVGPGIAASSPINYHTESGLSNFVDTSYIIKLSSGVKLKTPEGQLVSIRPTNKEGYAGNVNSIPDGFDYSGRYTKDGIDLLYASFTPKKTIEKGKTPLIIWLHGHSGGGRDPRLAVYGSYVVNLASEEIQSYFGDTGACLLIPQAPTIWMDYNGNMVYNTSVKNSAGYSIYTEALMGLITDYVANHPEIDTSRIYIGGNSNGGFMTINLLTLYPDYFAAAIPACGPFLNEWMTEEKLAAIVDKPIWFTHCKTDTTVKIYKTVYNKKTKMYDVKKNKKGKEIAIYEYTNALYDRLKKAGAKNVHYTLLNRVLDTSGRFFKKGTKKPMEYNGHRSWIYVLNNSCTDTIDGKKVTIFEWLSKQRKQ